MHLRSCPNNNMAELRLGPRKLGWVFLERGVRLREVWLRWRRCFPSVRIVCYRVFYRV